MLIWKYYPPTGVLKLHTPASFFIHIPLNLEVLPAYWGIETGEEKDENQFEQRIWKYYPPTGVLKLTNIILNSPRNSSQVKFGSTTRLLGY